MSFMNIGNKVVDNKARYKNENEENKNKLTYNFVTDPRLKRGHNYGVIYVTSSNYNENGMNPTTNANENYRSIQGKTKLKSINQNYKISQSVSNSINFKKYNMRGSIECKEKSFNDFGIYTEEVKDTTHPKPISFEVGLQTDPLPQRPVSPYPWPEKTGVDMETQVEDGDLFNFDEEVAPLVHVIVSKTLEDSRREVLEEEELKSIDDQLKKYAQKDKEEKEKIKNLEIEEQNRLNQRKNKKKEKEKKVELTKMFQQKLLCRKIGKQYINKLMNNTISKIEERGILKTADANDFYTDLLPEIQELAETNYTTDLKYYNVFNLLNTNYNKSNIEAHKNSILKEKARLANNERIRQILHERELAEKQRQKEERARRRHEKMLNLIRDKIKAELFVNSEWIEDNNLDNIYDINGYYQKNKCLTTVGGPIGQISIFFNIINKLNPELLNEEKINQIIDLYIQKSHPFYFLFKAEDLEFFKTLDENIDTIEDINKVPDDKYQNVIDKFIENNLVYDDMLKYLFDASKDESIQMETLEEMYKNIYSNILKRFKDGTDAGCVRFMQIEGSTEEIPLECICLLNLEKLEIDPPTENKKKKNNKVTYDHYFYEKCLMMPTVCDNFKIILINKQFDINFKHNLLECLNKLFPIEEEEKNTLLENLNQFYNLLFNKLLILLGTSTGKELVEMEIKQTEEEEEEKEGGEEEQ